MCWLMGTHLKFLAKALLMSAHNVWFYGEIRKYLIACPLLGATESVQRNYSNEIPGHMLSGRNKK